MAGGMAQHAIWDQGRDSLCQIQLVQEVRPEKFNAVSNPNDCFKSRQVIKYATGGWGNASILSLHIIL